jgi:hypothetical protein
MTLTFLDRFRPQPRQVALPTFDGLAQVRAYWEGLRQAGMPPARERLDPRGLGGVLDRVLLAERIGIGLAQVRMAGSALEDFAGIDLRGLPFSCLFAADARPLLAQALERVFGAATVVELDLGTDRQALGQTVARLLLLPLTDAAGGGLLLGAMAFADGQRVQGKLQILARRDEALPQEACQVLALSAPRPQPIRQVGHLALVHCT